jgi:sulfur carrier protein
MSISPTDTQTVTVTANGEDRRLPTGTTVVELLERMEIDGEQSGIAVAVDGAVVSRSDWCETVLEAGASIEVITATQGG